MKVLPRPINEFLVPERLPSSTYEKPVADVAKDRYFQGTINNLQRLSRLTRPIDSGADSENIKVVSSGWKIVRSAPSATTGLEEEFMRLKKLWNEDTAGTSSVTRILLSHYYLKIISLGPSVIPLILAELSKKPDHWFMALAVLSDSDPTKPGYTFIEATEAWLKWGRDHGYLND
jgi:hypothetical protein